MTTLPCNVVLLALLSSLSSPFPIIGGVRAKHQNESEAVEGWKGGWIVKHQKQTGDDCSGARAGDPMERKPEAAAVEHETRTSAAAFITSRTVHATARLLQAPSTTKSPHLFSSSALQRRLWRRSEVRAPDEGPLHRRLCVSSTVILIA